MCRPCRVTLQTVHKVHHLSRMMYHLCMVQIPLANEKFRMGWGQEIQGDVLGFDFCRWWYGWNMFLKSYTRRVVLCCVVLRTYHCSSPTLGQLRDYHNINGVNLNDTTTGTKTKQSKTIIPGMYCTCVTKPDAYLCKLFRTINKGFLGRRVQNVVTSSPCRSV